MKNIEVILKEFNEYHELLKIQNQKLLPITFFG